MENTCSLNSVGSIGSVLRRLVSHFENISGSELAKRTGLPISTVNRLLAGTVSDPRISTLKPLADYFRITVDQLLGYRALPAEYTVANDHLKPSMVIPIFHIKKDHNKINEPLQWFTWVTDKSDDKNATFAIALNTAEFEPVFEKDTILVVEPAMLPPQHADYIAVKSSSEDYLTIKRFLIDGEDQYFMPINTR